MPGHDVNDHQMRLYMKLRKTTPCRRQLPTPASAPQRHFALRKILDCHARNRRGESDGVRTHQETIVTVTSSRRFTLRKVFYTVPARLIGYRLRVSLYDDRLDLFTGGTLLITLRRGRSVNNGAPGHRSTSSIAGVAVPWRF
ncbi:hypothetical protein GGR40_003483 [Novosphingobium gossypii]